MFLKLQGPKKEMNPAELFISRGATGWLSKKTKLNARNIHTPALPLAAFDSSAPGASRAILDTGMVQRRG